MLKYAIPIIAIVLAVAGPWALVAAELCCGAVY
jgi:hypothetical protein